jgi:type V secretory pathway adhesin AidA
MASSTEASPDENLGNIEANSSIWYSTKGGSPQVIEPEGEWPNYTFRWDSIAPGRSAKIRFNVEVPNAVDGDLIQINAQSILDSTDETLAEAPDYSLGLIP